MGKGSGLNTIEDMFQAKRKELEEQKAIQNLPQQIDQPPNKIRTIISTKLGSNYFLVDSQLTNGTKYSTIKPSDLNPKLVSNWNFRSRKK